METEKILFRSEQKVSFMGFDNYYERIEKDVIINFLIGLPVDKIKELVNFKLIDPRKRIPSNRFEAEENNYLLDNQVIKIHTNIKL